jgi:hypothetical protein
LLVADSVFCVLDVRAFQTTVFRLLFNDKVARLTAATTAGTAVAPLGEVSNAMDWTIDLTTQL